MILPTRLNPASVMGNNETDWSGLIPEHLPVSPQLLIQEVYDSLSFRIHNAAFFLKSSYTCT